MPPIVIVGAGQAARLHLKAYMRLPAEIRPEQVLIIGARPDEAQALAQVAPASVRFEQAIPPSVVKRFPIVDICTPTHNHADQVVQLAGQGLRRFLIEKPAVLERSDLERLRDLPITVAVMHNYLFSRVTRSIVSTLENQELRPIELTTAFCKDRRHDSACGRGFFDGEPPHVLALELYHQLYLAEAIMGPCTHGQVAAQDMRIGTSVLPAHGAGTVALRHPSGRSVHRSCLYASEYVRSIRVTCADGTTLEGAYPNPRHGLSAQLAIVSDGGKRIQHFDRDDMMTAAIGHYVQWLAHRSEPGWESDVHDLTTLINDLRSTRAGRARAPCWKCDFTACGSRLPVRLASAPAAVTL